MAIILPAKEAVMVASQVARGLDLLNPSPTSFLTAKAARMKWQMSNRGDQALGRLWSWEADSPKEKRDMLVMKSCPEYKPLNTAWHLASWKVSYKISKSLISILQTVCSMCGKTFLSHALVQLHMQ